MATPPTSYKPKLYNRIAKHAHSVQEVADAPGAGGNLAVDDFEVRYLLLDDVWIVLGERALLRAYAPVLWNTLALGFGANKPGTARGNARSVWDTIHPAALRRVVSAIADSHVRRWKIASVRESISRL